MWILTPSHIGLAAVAGNSVPSVVIVDRRLTRASFQHGWNSETQISCMRSSQQ